MAKDELTAVKNGDKAAFEKLLGRYEALIYSECATVLAKAPEFKGESEELLQEGRLAIYSAAIKYQPCKEVTFGLYAKICIHNRLVSYIRKLVSAKRRRARAMDKAATERTGSSAEQTVIDFENSSNLRGLLHEEASAYEERVFSLYLEKKSYEQIAQTVGKNVKSVANAICRVKAKLRRRLK